MKRANVSDVARLAGVSTATVSRVLNDPDRVREPTREKVLQAIDELKFVKSATAFSFKVQHTYNVLVLVANVGNTYYSEVFHGLHKKAEAAGYNITLASPDEVNFSQQATERLRSGRVDGIIVLDGLDLRASDLDMLSASYGGAPPIVGFSEMPGQLSYAHVLIDNRKAAAEMTRYLISLGHRRIAHCLGPASRPSGRERLAGYRQALEEAGIEYDPDLVLPGGFEPERGREAARELLGRGDLPTAMFCANDLAAMGFIFELHRAGISVPRDISVAGFDNLGTTDVFIPALTTMDQPQVEIGETAMTLLLEVMQNPAGSVHRVAELATTLIVRESVGPPNAV